MLRKCFHRPCASIVALRAGNNRQAFPYEDGANPPEPIITEWLALVDKIAQQNAKVQ